jgi:hypothetical protein
MGGGSCITTSLLCPFISPLLCLTVVQQASKGGERGKRPKQVLPKKFPTPFIGMAESYKKDNKKAR